MWGNQIWCINLFDASYNTESHYLLLNPGELNTATDDTLTGMHQDESCRSFAAVHEGNTQTWEQIVHK